MRSRLWCLSRSSLSCVFAGCSRRGSLRSIAMASLRVSSIICVSVARFAMFSSKASPLCCVPCMSPAPRNLRSSSESSKPSFVAHMASRRARPSFESFSPDISMQ